MRKVWTLTCHLACVFIQIYADEYNSCNRQPKARHFVNIPCTFTSDVNFCAASGAAYPWQALIQFVNDNRSLMRRMYGDTRQSVLLRHEFDLTNHRSSGNSARSLHMADNEGGNPGNSSEKKAGKVEIPKEETKNEGFNACPSQVEVVSPYWANSTRGDLVAILNVYPFEQFVYFEKCTNEDSQMFCREGCRCEQQFGLQRLLAFDPQNECRGIFSEWFRFPSCCVCRCYHVNNENITGRQNNHNSSDVPTVTAGESRVSNISADGNSTEKVNGTLNE